jgi:hypothetical protein
MPLASATHTSLATELIYAMVRADSERLLISNFKCWVWVVFVGYSSTINSSDKLWFSSILKKIIVNINPQLDWDVIVDILYEFLWSHYYAASGKELWSTVQEKG